MWEKWVVNWFAKKTAQEVVLAGTRKTAVLSLHPPPLGTRGKEGEGCNPDRTSTTEREPLARQLCSCQAEAATLNMKPSGVSGSSWRWYFRGTLKKDPYVKFLRAHWEMSSSEIFLIKFHWTTLIFSSLNHWIFRKQKMTRQSCLLPPERWHIWFKEMLWEHTKEAPCSPKRFRRETKKESNPGLFGLFFLNFCMAMRGT